MIKIILTLFLLNISLLANTETDFNTLQHALNLITFNPMIMSATEYIANTLVSIIAMFFGIILVLSVIVSLIAVIEKGGQGLEESAFSLALASFFVFMMLYMSGWKYSEEPDTGEQTPSYLIVDTASLTLTLGERLADYMLYRILFGSELKTTTYENFFFNFDDNGNYPGVKKTEEIDGYIFNIADAYIKKSVESTVLGTDYDNFNLTNNNNNDEILQNEIDKGEIYKKIVDNSLKNLSQMQSDIKYHLNTLHKLSNLDLKFSIDNNKDLNTLIKDRTKNKVNIEYSVFSDYPGSYPKKGIITDIILEETKIDSLLNKRDRDGQNHLSDFYQNTILKINQNIFEKYINKIKKLKNFTNNIKSMYSIENKYNLGNFDYSKIHDKKVNLLTSVYSTLEKEILKKKNQFEQRRILYETSVVNKQNLIDYINSLKKTSNELFILEVLIRDTMADLLRSPLLNPVDKLALTEILMYQNQLLCVIQQIEIEKSTNNFESAYVNCNHITDNIKKVNDNNVNFLTDLKKSFNKNSNDQGNLTLNDVFIQSSFFNNLFNVDDHLILNDMSLEEKLSDTYTLHWTDLGNFFMGIKLQMIPSVVRIEQFELNNLNNGYINNVTKLLTNPSPEDSTAMISDNQTIINQIATIAASAKVSSQAIKSFYLMMTEVTHVIKLMSKNVTGVDVGGIAAAFLILKELPLMSSIFGFVGVLLTFFFTFVLTYFFLLVISLILPLLFWYLGILNWFLRSSFYIVTLPISIFLFFFNQKREQFINNIFALLGQALVPLLMVVSFFIIMNMTLVIELTAKKSISILNSDKMGFLVKQIISDKILIGYFEESKKLTDRVNEKTEILNQHKNEYENTQDEIAAYHNIDSNKDTSFFSIRKLAYNAHLYTYKAGYFVKKEIIHPVVDIMEEEILEPVTEKVLKPGANTVIEEINGGFEFLIDYIVLVVGYIIDTFYYLFSTIMTGLLLTYFFKVDDFVREIIGQSVQNDSFDARSVVGKFAQTPGLGQVNKFV